MWYSVVHTTPSWVKKRLRSREQNIATMAAMSAINMAAYRLFMTYVVELTC
jgi:hypothetical protein